MIMVKHGRVHFNMATPATIGYIAEVEPNVVQVYHEVEEGDGKTVYGTFFTVTLP